MVKQFEIQPALEVPPQYQKMDIMFYNSIKIARNSVYKTIVYHIIRLLLLVIFLPIDILVLKTTSVIIIVFMAVGIGLVTYDIIVSLGLLRSGYSDNRENNQYFLRLAKINQHSITSEPIRDLSSLNSLEDCTSQTLYNVASGVQITDEGLTTQIKNRYQGIFSNIIIHQVKNNSPFIDFFQRNGKLGSLGLVIFGIVALSIGSPNSAQIGVLVTFIVLQAINVLAIIVILIIIALSPILICGLCIWGCCCSPGERQFQIPQAIEASTQLIQKTQGTCPICFQSFVPKQKVIQLKCSQMHVFHEGCLTNWLRVSHTCPMCRKPIGQQN